MAPARNLYLASRLMASHVKVCTEINHKYSYKISMKCVFCTVINTTTVRIFVIITRNLMKPVNGNCTQRWVTVLYNYSLKILARVAM
jgi:hypothetical protein